MNFTTFLAYKFIRKSSGETSISIMIKVCFIGILIATFALALITAITNGFQKETQKKLQGIHADGIIRIYEGQIDWQKLQNILITKFSNQIEASSPTSFGQAIIQNPENSKTKLIALKAINPEQEILVTSIFKYIQKPDSIAELINGLKNKKLLIGQEIAKSLGLNIDDELNILFAEEKNVSRNKVTLDKYTAHIAGIFKTGIDEFDSNVIYISLELFQELFPEIGITEIQLKLKDNKENNLEILKKAFEPEMFIYSWKDLYPALLSALILEKYVTFLIIALIMLVAATNIISLIFMYITKKRGSIAILKSVGVADNVIQLIFLKIGLLISITASLIGIGTAALVSFILNFFQLIKLPDVYYVSHLPSHMDFKIIIAVFLLSNFLSFICTYYSCKLSKNISVASVLKFEG